MKIDFTKVLTDLDNSPILEAEEKPFTLGSAVKVALLTGFQDDKSDGKEKMKRFDLALKVSSAMNLENPESSEISSEEATIIRDMAGKVFTTLIVGRIYQSIT